MIRILRIDKNLRISQNKCNNNVILYVVNRVSIVWNTIPGRNRFEVDGCRVFVWLHTECSHYPIDTQICIAFAFHFPIALMSLRLKSVDMWLRSAGHSIRPLLRNDRKRCLIIQNRDNYVFIEFLSVFIEFRSVFNLVFPLILLKGFSFGFSFFVKFFFQK